MPKDTSLEAREKFVMAFNDTMLKIWQEQITLLDVIDTGHLLNSVKALPVRADGRFIEIGLSQLFTEYGLWQDFGTGKEIPRGNHGDIGREKKRVAIACVLSMNPDVLCFDEPLAGLDAKTRTWLLGFLKQLKSVGKTLVIATHDQSLADEVADYFVYMGDIHGYEDRPHVHING